MKAADADRWNFTKDITDDSSIRCPECKEVTPLSEWREGESYCEDCGSHYALICPSCSYYIDYIFDDEPIEVV